MSLDRATVLPFDAIAHRTIFVDLTDWQSIEQGRGRLADSARAIKSSDYKVSNPITRANASFKMRQSEDPKDRLFARLAEDIEWLKGQIADSARASPTSAFAVSASAEFVASRRMRSGYVIDFAQGGFGGFQRRAK